MAGRGAAIGALSGFAAGLVSGVILHLTWILAPLALIVARTPGPEKASRKAGLV